MYIINNYNKISGEIIHLCFDVVCRSEYGNIVFQKKTEKKDYIYTLPLNTEVYVKEAGIKFLAEITIPATIGTPKSQIKLNAV